ncbi:MAG: flagellar hook-basal body complex protein, partial [Phycisphaeraceae bacterium]
MAISALHSAASGLSALSTEIDVIANNLANVNTTGFKQSRVNFEDLLYQEKAQPGVENTNGDERPTGIYVGLGTRVSGTQLGFEQGPTIATDRDLDLTIDGLGFFQVDIGEASSTGIGYTRAGNFLVNSDGDIVLGNSDGPRLEPSLNVPEDTISIDITSDGRIFALQAGDVLTELG